MSFYLKDNRDEEIIWEYEFDKSKKVKTKELPMLMYAMTQVYNEQLDKMLKTLKSFIDTYPNCK